MNTKMKWTQLIEVAVLVAFASVFVSGPVAAVPGIPLRINRFLDTPPSGTNESSWTRFEQYMAASSPEEHRLSVRIPATNDGSWARFEQYMAASTPEEYRITTKPAKHLKTVDNSWVRFEQYIAASMPETDRITAMPAK